MASIQDDYYFWMLEKIETSDLVISAYDCLLTKLHITDFTYLRPMDGNLAAWGIDLRYRFGYERDIPQPIIAAELDDRRASILEVMVSLALRLEENVMSDPDYGNRTGVWFWSMIKSIGLMHYPNKRYRNAEVTRIITDCLNRDINRDGRGWFFTIKDSDEDLRNVDIWTAAMWWLNTIE